MLLKKFYAYNAPTVWKFSAFICAEKQAIYMIEFSGKEPKKVVPYIYHHIEVIHFIYV